jgi:Zn ribbon nucleic-acid-binding protein
MSNIYCPICGAHLNDQWGFEDSMESWTCTECGTEIYSSDYDYREIEDDEDEDDFELQKIKKDILKKLLKVEKKKGDVTMTDVLENSGPLFFYCFSKAFEEDEENTYEDEDCDCNEFYDYTDTDNDEHYEDNDTNAIEELQKSSDVFVQYYLEKNQKTSRIRRKVIPVLLLILCLAGFGGYKYVEYKKSIIVGVSSNEVIGSNYEEIVRQLEHSGFTHVSTQADGDLTLQEFDMDARISSITIGRKDNFEACDKFPYDSKVTISYHSLKEIEIPISYQSAKDMSYSELETVLTDAGFISIRLEKDSDLITGWINKEDSVENVTINGEDGFKENDTFRPDAEIIITYHAFKE